MKKNTVGKWAVFAFGGPGHASAGLPIAGNAANITAKIRKDGGVATSLADANPTPIEGGFYAFDLTAAETNGDHLILTASSSTANVQVIGVPAAVYTRDVTPSVTIAGTLTTLDALNTAQGLRHDTTQSALATIANYVDTEVATILANTGSSMSTKLDAIKAITDKMVFTSANLLDVNTRAVNSANLVGNGRDTPWDAA